MRSVYHTPSLPRTGRQVLGQHLKCSELDQGLAAVTSRRGGEGRWDGAGARAGLIPGGYLGTGRVSDLTQQWTWRGMLSDQRILSLGRPAWVNSAGRKNLKQRRKRSSRRTRASSSRSLRRAP